MSASASAKLGEAFVAQLSASFSLSQRRAAATHCSLARLTPFASSKSSETHPRSTLGAGLVFAHRCPRALLSRLAVPFKGLHPVLSLLSTPCWLGALVTRLPSSIASGCRALSRYSGIISPTRYARYLGQHFFFYWSAAVCLPPTEVCGDCVCVCVRACV